MGHKYDEFSDQYRVFSEFPDLDDQAIVLFLQTAQGLHNVAGGDRGNAMGIFQAHVGMWQILARQGEIPNSDLNQSWQQLITPFPGIRTAAQVYDAGRASVAELFQCSTGSARVSQDTIINLLAGPAQSGTDGKEMH